jgi:hypothetical protein
MKKLIISAAMIAAAVSVYGQGLNTYDGVTYIKMIAPQQMANGVAVAGDSVDRTAYKGKATFMAFGWDTNAAPNGYVKLQTAPNSTGVWADVSGLSHTIVTNPIASTFSTYQFIQQDQGPYLRAYAICTNATTSATARVAAFIVTY